MKIRTKINEKEYELDVRPWETLLSLLRDRLGLTGTKEGCGAGECGACTVIINGKTACSCMVPASQADESSILTIEGVESNGGLHTIQKCFMEEGAVQCGFCTPGMIMSAYALLSEEKDPSEDQIREAIAGNLCRCTGYDKIIKAIKKAGRNILND